MKNIKSTLLTFVICFFIYNCNGQSKNTEKKIASELNTVNETATQYLYNRIVKDSKAVKKGNKITLGDKSIEVNLSVEFDGQQEGKWIYASNFSTIVKTSKKIEFNISSIGIGNSREEAINVSIQEWIAAFGIPLSDMLNNKNGYKISETMVFSGLMGIRGNLPENTWLNGDTAMTTKIISHLSQLIKSEKDEIVTIDIKLLIGKNGVLDGECKLENKVSTELLNKLKTIEWPVSGEGYLFKQFYIIKKL
ncbi:MAG: DUF6348 family protein [Kordia sp.]|uniref:DUF6348 family protein n=1 Tax=Kordia sp. TaxID=1965332 RepID=UPI003858125E